MTPWPDDVPRGVFTARRRQPPPGFLTVRLTGAMVARLARRSDGTVTPPGCFGLRPVGGDRYRVVDVARVQVTADCLARWACTRSDLALARRLGAVRV